MDASSLMTMKARSVTLSEPMDLDAFLCHHPPDPGGVIQSTYDDVDGGLSPAQGRKGNTDEVVAIAEQGLKAVRISTDVDVPRKDDDSSFPAPGSPDNVVLPVYSYDLLSESQKRISLVLDMDECLVHSEFGKVDNNYRQDEDRPEVSQTEYADSFEIVMEDGETARVFKRPGLQRFLEEVCQHFDVFIFTAGLEIYGKAVIDKLDPDNRLFKGRLYRESCVFQQGFYLKDLSIVNDDFARVLLVDNNPISFLPQPDNGIPVPSFYSDAEDRALDTVLDVLMSLKDSHDVRPTLRQMFNLPTLLEPHRKKIWGGEG